METNPEPKVEPQEVLPAIKVGETVYWGTDCPTHKIIAFTYSLELDKLSYDDGYVTLDGQWVEYGEAVSHPEKYFRRLYPL
jgi:hypothetical protein